MSRSPASTPRQSPKSRTRSAPLVERYNIGILLTDHQFRETLEVTDRCYVISEGTRLCVRKSPANPRKPRRATSLHRRAAFDVGHLLDRRRPASLPHSAPAPDPAVAEIDSAIVEVGHDVAETGSYDLPEQTISTNAFIGQLDHYTVEYSGGPDPDLESEESD